MTQTCSNCACFARLGPNGQVSEDPAAHPVCRRSTPVVRIAPRPMATLDARGLPGQATEVQLGYPATVPDGICWDGWRPIGTAPGENWQLTRFLQRHEDGLGAGLRGA